MIMSFQQRYNHVIEIFKDVCDKVRSEKLCREACPYYRDYEDSSRGWCWLGEYQNQAVGLQASKQQEPLK